MNSRQTLLAVADRVRQDAEDLAVQAEKTKDETVNLAANVAINSWLILGSAACGSDEEVEIALDIVKDDFPELLPN